MQLAPAALAPNLAVVPNHAVPASACASQEASPLAIASSDVENTLHDPNNSTNFPVAVMHMSDFSGC